MKDVLLQKDPLTVLATAYAACPARKRAGFLRDEAKRKGLAPQTLRRTLVTALFVNRLDGPARALARNVPLSTLEVVMRLNQRDPAEAHKLLEEAAAGTLSFHSAIRREKNWRQNNARQLHRKASKDAVSETELLKMVTARFGIKTVKAQDMDSDPRWRLCHPFAVYRWADGDVAIYHDSDLVGRDHVKKAAKALIRNVLTASCLFSGVILLARTAAVRFVFDELFWSNGRVPVNLDVHFSDEAGR